MLWKFAWYTFDPRVAWAHHLCEQRRTRASVRALTRVRRTWGGRERDRKRERKIYRRCIILSKLSWGLMMVRSSYLFMATRFARDLGRTVINLKRVPVPCKTRRIFSSWIERLTRNFVIWNWCWGVSEYTTTALSWILISEGWRFLRRIRYVWIIIKEIIVDKQRSLLNNIAICFFFSREQRGFLYGTTMTRLKFWVQLQNGVENNWNRFFIWQNWNFSLCCH